MSEKEPRINVDQNNIDTGEREIAFHKRKSFGHEEAYAENREAWFKNPTEGIVSDFPLHVDIELSSICNLKCPMCPTGTEEFKRTVPRKYVDPQLFRKIVDECAENNLYSLRLSWIGEPTLHPQYLELLKYAKQAGIAEVSHLTHGKRLLDKSFCKEIVAAGLDWITISIDGVDEAYEAIRRPIKFQQIVEAVTNIYGAREEAGSMKPAIKIQGVWPAVKQNFRKYIEVFTPITDLIFTNPLIDYLHLDTDAMITYVDHFTCYQPFQRIMFRSDGRAAMCSNDDVLTHETGDANVNTLKEIWHGKAFSHIRDLHLQHRGHLELKACKRCHVPRTREKEILEIDGRKIMIDNYKSRKQIIGQ